MIYPTPFKREHYDRVLPKKYGPALSEIQLKWMEKENSVTFLDQEGEVVACLGLVRLWHGRAEAWAMFNSERSKHLLAVHRWVKQFLDAAPFRRIEAVVVDDFAPGHRWMRMLGFRRESVTLQGYFPDGGPGVLYSKVNLHG